MVSLGRTLPQTASGRSEPTHYHVLYTAILQLRYGHLSKMTFMMLWALGSPVSLARHGVVMMFLPVMGILGFIAIFPIYVLRKARLHTDSRPHPSLAIHLYRQIISKSYVRVSIIYIFSSIIITQIYCSEFSDLALFLPKRDFELSKVNEKRIYINALSVYVALIYAAIHCLQDIDRLSLPSVKTDPMLRVKQVVYPEFRKSLVLSVVLSIISIPVYLPFRGYLWRNSLFFGRFLATLHKSTATGSFPFTPLHSVLVTFTLLFMWSMANEMCTIYLTLGALHRGKGISERSSDPNGTLLTGLRRGSKKQFTRRTAFQELRFIAYHDGRRRDSIYKDVEKPSTWQQITSECLNVLEDLRNTLVINSDLSGKSKLQARSTVAVLTQPSPSTSPTPPPIKMRRENIFLSAAPVNASPASKLERKLLEGLQDPQAVQSYSAIAWFQDMQKWLKRGKEELWNHVIAFLSTPYGAPFRCTIQRKVSKLVSNRELVSDAISALTDLVVNSMIEDTFGTVQRDIPRILSEFDQSITIMEMFIQKPPLHWSDVINKKKLVNGRNPVRTSDAIELDELDVLVDELTEAFDRIVHTFDKYLLGMGLSPDVYRRCGVSLRHVR
ncbi:nucleoporin protein Ndc1-Nup [Lipomyces orientalis]|uniref:Nucleoporin protein Ndc1-Nup n=1 Tax=Lipomyces orientalis TaxID=1233043 RepID=A0ACC3THM8_9ASCO